LGLIFLEVPLIAAIAISHDLTLVTHNTKEFARVEGLKLEDWEIDA
jgi:tRNA(fMet)-specific endonuclease VapC